MFAKKSRLLLFLTIFCATSFIFADKRNKGGIEEESANSEEESSGEETTASNEGNGNGNSIGNQANSGKENKSTIRIASLIPSSLY